MLVQFCAKQEIKLYDKGYHMIWHDCIGNQAYNDVQQWMEMRMGMEKRTKQIETNKATLGKEIISKSEDQR